MTADARADTQKPMETRRSRLRRELTADIVRIAREQLTENGPGGVTWRAIARELGMNPASLYTYFESLDALFTTLILESYTALGVAVQEAFEATVDSEPVEQVMACVHAYRRWAVTKPAEFNLIFTDQIPGYVAPDDAGTFEAEMAVIRPMVHAMDRVTGRSGGEPGLVVTDDADASIGAWATMHGLVTLEINNHLPRDGGEARFDRIVRGVIASVTV